MWVDDLMLFLQVESLLPMVNVLGVLYAIGFVVVFLVVGDDVIRVGIVYETVYDSMLPFQERLLLIGV